MIHPTHSMRTSDSSLYDAVCERCGATDDTPATATSDARLRAPCPDYERERSEMLAEDGTL